MHNTYVSGTLCSMLFQAVKINKLTNPERTFFFLIFWYIRQKLL